MMFTTTTTMMMITNHSFPGSGTGMDSFLRFDPAGGRWEQLLPENCTSPTSRSGFGLTATRNGSSWTFWLFGGMADSAYFSGKCSGNLSLFESSVIGGHKKTNLFCAILSYLTRSDVALMIYPCKIANSTRTIPSHFIV
jgi:hypothetical protein